MAGKKIGELTPLGRNLIATDELELSLAGSAGSRKITGQEIIDAVGGVTSVDMTTPTGLTVTGNPITGAGTLALGLQSGYSIPTTANQSNWTTAYNDSITSANLSYGGASTNLVLNQQDSGTISANLIAGAASVGKFVFYNGSNLAYIPLSATTPLSYNSGSATFSISQSGASTDGYLSSVDWNTFNSKQAALVSGTNIKTINGSSVLGSGDLVVGGGLEGTQYVFVAANGTDVENAQELQSAYNTAQTMSPSSTNRITVIAAPGNYKFFPNFVMGAPWVDLVSLDGNKSIVFNGPGTIQITANDVFVKGVDVKTLEFKIADALASLRVENCSGGDYSFGAGLTTSGTFTNCIGGAGSFGNVSSGIFTNCIGGDNSFGSNAGTASGTFTDCSGGSNSFGSNVGTSSGVFTNCKGGDNSFGGFASTVSGTFTNCSGGDDSFGGGGTASGVFTNCIGGYGSFGGNGTSSGTFTDCSGGNNSFGGGSEASGTFTDCSGGNNSFGGGSEASGTFTNCIGGNNSFGGNYGTASGVFTNCTGGDDSFGMTLLASGTFTYCTGGDNSFGGNYGTASGVFTNCIGGYGSFGGFSLASGTFTSCSGGEASFGGDGGEASGTFTSCLGGDISFGSYGIASGMFTNCIGGSGSFGGFGLGLDGKLYYCRLTSGSFETVTSPGITRLCIDGNNVINNQG